MVRLRMCSGSPFMKRSWTYRSMWRKSVGALVATTSSSPTRNNGGRSPLPAQSARDQRCRSLSWSAMKFRLPKLTLVPGRCTHHCWWSPSDLCRLINAQSALPSPRTIVGFVIWLVISESWQSPYWLWILNKPHWSFLDQTQQEISCPFLQSQTLNNPPPQLSPSMPSVKFLDIFTNTNVSKWKQPTIRPDFSTDTFISITL